MKIVRRENYHIKLIYTFNFWCKIEIPMELIQIDIHHDDEVSYEIIEMNFALDA